MAAWVVLASGPARAQAQGEYPATLFCEAGAGRPALRASVTVDVAPTSSRYGFATSLGRETGSGALSGRVLVLSGSGKGQGGTWTARYSGEVTGRGGLLTGAQSFGTLRRACQITLGDGRG